MSPFIKIAILRLLMKKTSVKGGVPDGHKNKLIKNDKPENKHLCLLDNNKDFPCLKKTERSRDNNMNC